MLNAPESHDGAPAARRPVWLLPVDAVRGFLIGMAELVPGVSGGTVALVTGVYEEIIGSANHVVTGLRRFLSGPERRASLMAELRRTDWLLIVPILIGMAAAVFGMAGVMSGFVTGSPELARGLFLGMVAASVVVPLKMLPPRAAGRRSWPEALVLLAAVGAAFIMTSLAGSAVVADPPLVLVAAAAAVAICALVLPGVSGSFFLLAVGLYAPTLTAIHDRDLSYIGAFGLGAAVGLAGFVKVIHHLLEHHRRTTLIVMAGLMVGSLRALWPWQSVAAADGKGAGILLAPHDPVLGPVLLAVLGAVVVLALVAIKGRMARA